MKTFINKLQAGDNSAQLVAFGVLLALVLGSFIIAYFTGHYKLDVIPQGV